MQKFVSGAVGFYVPYTTERKIYLPDILDLKGKRIKHIDVVPLSLAVDETPLIGNYSSYDFYLNLMEKNTNDYKIKDLPFSRLDISVNNGNKMFINKIVDFPNSYIENLSSVVPSGEGIFLVAWYDEPQIMEQVKLDGRTLYDSFECIAQAAPNGRFLFGENRTLYGRKFRNIIFPYFGVQTTTPKGNTTPTLTDGYVTLQKNNLAYLRNVPLRCFYQLTDAYELRLQNITFDFTNSFVAVAPSLVSANVGKSFFFNVEIDDNK